MRRSKSNRILVIAAMVFLAASLGSCSHPENLESRSPPATGRPGKILERIQSFDRGATPVFERMLTILASMPHTVMLLSMPIRRWRRLPLTRRCGACVYLVSIGLFLMTFATLTPLPISARFLASRTGYWVGGVGHATAFIQEALRKLRYWM